MSKARTTTETTIRKVAGRAGAARRRKAAALPPALTPEARALQAATQRFSARRARDRLPHRIETRRLVLRAPIRGDVPALVKLADNRTIAARLARLPSPYTRADAIAFVEIYAQRADERPYAVTLDDKLVGVVGFSFLDGRPPELGYWLGEPYWGQGLMSEAVAALLEAAGSTGVFPLVGARALADNAASLRVLEKAGFVPTGEVVERHEQFGERRAIVLLRETRG